MATAGAISASSVAAARTDLDSSAVSDASSAADEGSIVETYQYPNSDKILAEQKVKLISGDGHILLVSCATPAEGDVGLIKVRTTVSGVALICFKVSGTTGLLNLEVPAVFEIRGDGLTSGAGHNITAIVTTDDGPLPPINVNPSGSTGVGIGDPAVDTETMLLQLKVSP
jgi:hypothetical protein